ncbi:hypothetical protein RND81_08G134600 [Saponaria officinalis]|uniref:PHD-type domain-containing protein n=1 Tax=Saponaria officinalis TaxID=3572 RepID=A0AAW1J779_SAPOF
MAHRKRSVRENDPANFDIDMNGGALRQNLPRRCKNNQPFYGIDNFLDDEEIDKFSKRIKKGLGSSSYRGPSDDITLRQKDAEESKNLTVLSWLIDMKVVKEDTAVGCFRGAHRKMLTQGRIRRDGIFCYCCSKKIPAFEFPSHIRNYLGDEPYENVFVEGMNVSLLNCQIEAWNRHSVPARNGYYHVVKRPRVRDHHDDSCLICADGGDLMCCDTCPSTYHPRCLGFEGVPRDEWHCPYCRCRYCDRDSSTELLLTCVQCLKKYHWQCSERYDSIPSSLQSSSIPFCGKSCWQVYRNLEGIVGRTMAIMPGVLSWVLVRRMDVDVAGHHTDELHRRVTCNSMVALAAKLMEDCFKVIVDRQTRTNMIQSVVYSCGSNFTRTNFSRFYTAVLQLGGNIVTVASVRTPSPDVAEIPFIATAENWRNSGLCKLLLLALESALAEMGVERILIPSAENMVKNWQEKFGFGPLDQAMKRRITTLNTLTFPMTTRLQKIIRPRRRMIVDDLNLPPPEAADFCHDAF